MKHDRIRSGILLLCLLTALSGFGIADESLTVKASGELCSFGSGIITVHVPESGLLSVSVSQADCLLGEIVRGLPVQPGELTIPWNGLGVWEEPLSAGKYMLKAELTTDSGTQECKASVSLSRANQALLYALPASDTLYLAEGSRWYAEVELAHRGEVRLAVYRSGSMQAPVTAVTRQAGSGPYAFHWNGAFDGRQLEPGEYVFRFYAARNPGWWHDCRVTVREGVRPVPPLAVTGDILTDLPLEDEALWALMQQPSAVADRLPTHHLDLLSSPEAQAAPAGSVHGRTQALSVLEIRDDGWVYAGAWDGASGKPVRGWVRAEELTMAVPQREYGLAVDLQEQTLTLYHRGKRAGTVSVSSGLATEKHPERFTTPGLFLTAEHMPPFANEGYHYEHVIRYDGGNLLHQIGYVYQNGLRSFAAQQELRGSMASHGCIRMPAGAGSRFNAWWIYTHIPAGTRVVILPAREEEP